MSDVKVIQVYALHSSPAMRTQDEVSFEESMRAALGTIRKRCEETGREIVGTPTGRLVPAAELGAHVFTPDDVYLVVTADVQKS